MTNDEFLIGDWPNMPASTRSWPRCHVTLEITRVVGYDGVGRDEPVLCDRADHPIQEERLQKPTAVFERFVGLADEDDLAVLNFASQHGTLGLCRHGVPLTLIPSPSCTRHRCRVAGSAGEPLLLEGERPVHWRRLASQFLAAIEIARTLDTDSAPSTSAVDRLLEGVDHFPDVENVRSALLGGFVDGPPPLVSDVRELEDRDIDNRPRKLASRQVAVLREWYFRRLINHWLTPATAAPLVRSQLSRPGFQMEAGMPDLFSTLALQLALIVTKTRSFVLCSFCHRPTVHHRATAGTRARCTRPDCRRDQARIDQQLSRDKRRAQSRARTARILAS